MKIVLYYNLLINIRDINKRTNLGNVFFENTYIIITSNIKAKVIWFIK
jgi:ATP-dependent Clp protease ATP-binding subunit ClpA